MSPDEARDVFSEAFEGDLEDERRVAFDRALASDEELRAEYDDFLETFQMMGRMGEADLASAPNLLPGVQERLRKRSRGRYYRDSFAKRAGPTWMLPLVASIAVLMILAVAWYALESIVVLEEPSSPSSEPTTAPR